MTKQGTEIERKREKKERAQARKCSGLNGRKNSEARNEQADKTKGLVPFWIRAGKLERGRRKEARTGNREVREGSDDVRSGRRWRTVCITVTKMLACIKALRLPIRRHRRLKRVAQRHYLHTYM